jgi:hypothetical protein
MTARPKPLLSGVVRCFMPRHAPARLGDDAPAFMLNEDRMLVIEKVFGFLLAAMTVQLVPGGLASVGVIPLQAS